MKLLLFVDSHGSAAAFKKLKKKTEKHKPDLIVCAGDFTIFEVGIKKILEQFNKLGREMLIIHGNHEAVTIMRKNCRKLKNITFIHKKTKAIEDTLFLGHGGGGFERKTPDFKKFIKKNMKKIKKHDKVVFVTHQPPFGTKLDKIAKHHCGNLSYRESIEKIKPTLVVTGHLHENAKKKDKIGESIIINPGPYGQLIDI